MTVRLTKQYSSRSKLMLPSSLSVRGDAVNLYSVELTQTSYMLRGTIRSNAGSNEFGNSPICYKLSWQTASGPHTWFVFSQSFWRDFRLLQGDDGDAYLTCVAGKSIAYDNIAFERSFERALDGFLYYCVGARPDFSRFSVERYLPITYFRSYRDGYRLSVQGVTRDRIGRRVVRVHGSLPFDFVFVGDDIDWRVTWASKYQLWLFAFGLALFAIGMRKATQRALERRTGRNHQTLDAYSASSGRIHMPITIKSLGHSCFTLSDGQHTIIFDPYLTDNPDAVCGPDDVQVDAVLPSHGHSDHLGDTIAMSKRLGCPVIAAYELCMYCARFGCEVVPMHIGGARALDFGTVKLTQATHGSAVITDDLIEYTGPAVGFVVNMGGLSVYYAGDTGLFGDMRLIGDAGVDVAILPIGDCFTMGPADALLAAEMLRPRVVIPTHYSAFDVIKQDAAAFADELNRRNIRCEPISPGQDVEIT